ncbi:MAG TPA: hypothetical protein VK147_01840 [Candidatus Didemnitutus sp.]|nr:hypothetical protein [Candidatus Didemnitutus sp.]
MIRGRPLQYAMVLLLACLAACTDHERWEAIIDRTLTLDSVKTIKHVYWEEQTGVSYNVLIWWDGHLLCKRDVQHDTSVKLNFLQEVDLANHVVRPFSIGSFSRVHEVASGQGAVAALVDSNGLRVLWRKRPGSNFTDIGIPDSFRMPSGYSTKHIAVCSTAVLLVYGDSVYSWLESSTSWRRSILGPSNFEFGFGAYTEIIPSPYGTDTSFILANDIGEWGGSCFRVRLAPTGEVFLDRILADDNCQFLFSDRRSRLWMVGSLFHMRINHSWIRTVEDSISVTIMNQEASYLDSVSTRLRTRNGPSVVLNETGFISGACMTDTSLLFMYEDSGIFELRVQPGFYTPQSALRQLLRIKRPRGSHWRMLIADDRNGGVIIAPGLGGLLHVASLHDRPRFMKIGDQ